MFTGLCPGTYTITVVDGNNATSTSVATIGAASQIVFGASTVVNPGCNPNNNGSISISASGGAGNIVYGISPLGPQGPGGVFTGLTAQNYTISATDANGCSITTVVSLVSPASPTIVMTGVTNITCNGLCNGSSQAVASGGVPGYTYSIVPGTIDANTGQSSGLCAGVYTVTVVDQNGCSATTSFTITEPPVLLINNIMKTDPLCSGQMNGSIVISLGGGVGQYVYSIQPALGVQGPAGTFTGLGAGQYTVTGVDGNGCSVTTVVDIIEPSGLLWTSVVGEDISCYGAGDGKITVLASGGTGQITYSIQPQVGQPTPGYFDMLTPQCYTVSATDANGCSITTVVCIVEPGPITFNAPVVQDNLCHGGQSGEIMISVNGGTPPFSYTLQPGGQVSNNGQFSGLGSGSYTVMVVDTNGCSAVSGAIIIKEPSAIVFNTVNVHEVYCYGDSTGSIAVVASGGTGNISFSLQPVVGTQLPLGFFKYLRAGTYTVTATDGNGCSVTTLAVVQENPKLEVTSVSIVEPICAYDSTGVIQVSGTGGVAPLMYSLNNGIPKLTGTFTGLVIAQYKLTLIDNLGCSYDTTIDLTGPTLVGANIRIEPTKCIDSEDGRVFVEGTGGRGGYKYFITPGLHINKSGIFLDLAAGTYTLRVVDTVGCEYQTTIVVSPPSNPLWTTTTKQDLGCYGRGDEGSATVVANGGELPYVYEWSTVPVQNTATASNLYFGWYYVSVTDANGCVERDSVYVSEGPCCEIAFIPSAFSPNGDNQNDEFRVLTTAGVELIQFEIYDRWGQRVWATSDWKRGWDGRIDGADAGVGTYYYVLRYRCTLDGKTYMNKIS